MSIKHRENTKHRILQPVESSMHPTKIEVMRHPGTGAYQWWGNDGHPYSAASDNLQAVINVATTTKLTKI